MTRSIALLAIAAGLAACSAQPPHREMAHGGPLDATRPVHYDSLGSYSYPITASPQAQRWFDQGLRLVYGFNHYEARKAFTEAARLDPRCAMCLWGLAMTEGSNYNSPTDADREKAALAAVRQALQLAQGGRPTEGALIQALAKRHAADPGTKREILDRAYADAMRD